MNERGAPRAALWRALWHRHGVGRGRALGELRALVVPRGHAGHVVRGVAHHHPRTVHGLAYLGLLMALWVLNAADIAVTLHWTGAAGWAAEGNAIMRVVAQVVGPFGFVVYKLVLMTLVVAVLWWLFLQMEDNVWRARRRGAVMAARIGFVAVHVLTVGLVAFYAWVVWNNLGVAGLA